VISNVVVIVCALDTKGVECKYIKGLIEAAGVQTITMNTGVLGDPYFTADITNEQLAKLAGTRLEDLISQNDRGFAVEAMMNGAVKKVTAMYQQGEIGGIIGLGGSAGTTVATAAMRALPVGIPKVMVSTIASGNTRPYVGMKDITMVNSIVDISGLNSISRKTLGNAAFSLIGMMKGEMPINDEARPIIAATMFGVTTACVTYARDYLEERGYEVLIFHATGVGGQAMESLIESGLISGVLDVTTTELADEVAKGLLSSGPNRLEAAGKRGVPQVVSMGALDMVNFGSFETVPEPLRSRNLYKHNHHVTLMRTSVEENRKIGEMIAKKLNQTQGPTTVFLPLKGVSELDSKEMPFYGPQEDLALFDAVRQSLVSPYVEIVEMDVHINDKNFALAMADKLLEMINAK
jgi:uncharacterized protein (UPF0261 family)